MTNEQLALEIQKGNNELIGQLWEQVEKLIYWLAQRLHSRFNRFCVISGLTLDDIIQPGSFHKNIFIRQKIR